MIISQNRRDEIVNIIKRIYAKMNAKPLPRYAVPHLYLKEFTTTKSEKKKNKYRLPDETYRLPDDPPVIPAKPKEPEPVGGIDSFEETKIKSKILYQRHTAEKGAALADFKTIKKLGKGNFGTV